MNNRTKPPDNVTNEVITMSRRRCCLCYGLNNDIGIKRGQIAHLDHNRNNNNPDNLAFLCLDHHDIYDSIPSQSKGFTIGETKTYRNELYNKLKQLVIQKTSVLYSPILSMKEEQEALNFHTCTHRSQSVVLLVEEGPKSLAEINDNIPPCDIDWTKSFLEEVIYYGWVRRSPTDYSTFELSMNGRRMLDVLSTLPDNLKEIAWRAVWQPE